MADPRSEPSMEDILASIKRIIADDQAPPLSPLPPTSLPAPRAEGERPSAWPAPGPATFDRPSAAWPARTEAPPPADSILELTNPVPEVMPPSRVPPIEMPEPQPPVPEAPPRQESPIPRPIDPPRQPDISWSVPEEAVPPAPPEPARPIATRDIGELIVNRASGGDNTLEALVREMLRPMLSDWIDAHLPAMVEQIVQDEIRKMMEREDKAG